MPVGDVYRLAQRMALEGQTIINVYHFQVAPGGFGVGSEADLASAFGTWTATFQAAMSSAVTFVDMSITKLIPAGTATVIVPYAAGTTGGRGAGVMPPNVSASITVRTAVIGRHGHGRKQIAGLLLSDNNNGSWAAGAQGFLDAIAALYPLQIAGPGDNYRYCITNKPPAGGFIISKLVIAAQAQTTIRTQRSRTVGIGI